MNPRRFIAFDLGAESGRCVVGELTDDALTLTEVHRFQTPNVLFQQHLYWDVLGIYTEILTGLKKVREMFGPHFDGISVDTWGVDYVLLDAENRLLGYPYHYRDSRTDGMIDKACKQVDRDTLYRETGSQFLQINTLYQLLAEEQRHVNLLRIADTLLMMPDFFLFSLCGVKKAEFTIVSTTQLADPFKRNWNRALIKKFDFPEWIFPPVVEPGSVLGHLLPDIAESTGLDPDIPIIASASHDTAAAVASVPALDGNWAFLSSGTWSLMGVETAEPIINQRALQYNFTNEGGVGGTTRFLQNIIGLWPVQQCRRAFLNEGKEFTYAELTQWASETGFANAWINLDDPRFLKPGDMPQKIIDFLKETGQNYRIEPGWIIRCLLESLAFKYRQTARNLEKTVGHRIEKLHAVGGGTRNELLNQLAADALGFSVVAGPVEGTVIGNIGMQAVATGVLRDVNHLRQITASSFQLKTYEPRNSDYFDRHEKDYEKLTQK